MNYKYNPLYRAVYNALEVGAVAGLIITSMPALSEDQEAVVLDRVQVTGSRLSRVDIEGATPVTVLDRTDIERTGVSDLGEILRKLPSITGSPLGTSTNNGGDGSSGTDIRGLGINRTLVLINGKRDVTDGDFSLIPLAVVERIEVLKEGASPIYGADAIAGVVNVITRRDFQGAQLQAQIGQSFITERNPAADINPAFKGTDGEVKRVSFVFGDTTDRGSFVIGTEYNEQDPVFQGNIDKPQFRSKIRILGPEGQQFFLENGLDACLEAGLCDELGGSSSSLGGRFVFFEDPANPSNFFDLAREIAPGVFLNDLTRDLETGAIRRFTFEPGASDLYNFAPVNFIQTPFERTNLFVQGDYELFEHVNATIEARYSNRRSGQFLAPTPLFIGFDDPAFPFPDGGVGIPADNPFNPFGIDLNTNTNLLLAARRIAEDRRTFEQEVNQIQINSSLRGDFGGLAPTWTWEVSFNWGRIERADQDFGQLAGAPFAQALGPGFFDADGVARCGTPGQPTPNCVPFDLFGGLGTITGDQLDFVSATLNDKRLQKLQDTQITIQGDLLDLPAGPVALALGFENRREELVVTPDSGKATESVTGRFFEATEGEFDINSLFAEVNVPLLSGVPGAELFEIGAGFRLDSFDQQTGGDTGNFMVNGRWQPVKGLLIRGSGTEVFREPTITDRFEPQIDRLSALPDPCQSDTVFDPGDNRFAMLTPDQQQRCIDQGVPPGGSFQLNQTRIRIGGNPDVRPETGETFTIGAALVPEELFGILPGFSLTVDYWDVDLQGGLNVLGPLTILDNCILDGLQEFCELIFRSPFNGQLDQVINVVTNINRETAKGIDAAIDYTFNSAIGLFDFRLLGTFLDERRAVQGVSDINAAGTFDVRNGLNEAAFPEFKANLTMDWSYREFGMSLNVEFLDSFTEVNVFGSASRDNPQGSTRKIGTTWYVDWTGRWTAPWGTTVAYGVTNLNDSRPPFIVGGFNANTDTDTFRLLGRSWFTTLTHNF